MVIILITSFPIIYSYFHLDKSAKYPKQISENLPQKLGLKYFWFQLILLFVLCRHNNCALYLQRYYYRFVLSVLKVHLLLNNSQCDFLAAQRNNGILKVYFYFVTMKQNFML